MKNQDNRLLVSRLDMASSTRLDLAAASRRVQSCNIMRSSLRISYYKHRIEIGIGIGISISIRHSIKSVVRRRFRIPICAKNHLGQRHRSTIYALNSAALTISVAAVANTVANTVTVPDAEPSTASAAARSSSALILQKLM